MRNNLVLCANGKRYQVVSGSVISEEFSETLDSATVVLDNVPKEDRLELEPYMFVRLKNLSTDNAFAYDKEFLVDSFDETEENISQHIYKYTISLMSETKLLEKWQCPNLMISHSLKNGKKSIYEHLSHFFELYVPKVKMYDETTQKWAYKQIISLGDDIKERFGNIPCADLSLQSPTLRQVFTTLMLQDGCIPVVSERKLTYMDLGKESTVFSYGNDGINKVKRSNSSDSFVNALITQSDQLLDSGNSVLCETLGFRDKNNALIKQTENLKLETSFPIYSINKATMRVPCRIKSNFVAYCINYKASAVEVPYVALRLSSGVLGFYVENLGLESQNFTILDCHIVFYKGVYVVSEKRSITPSSIVWGSWNETSVPSDLTQSDKFYFYLKVRNETTGKYGIVITRICQLSPSLVENLENDYEFDDGEGDLYGYLKADITANIVESSKRKLLDTDFTTMPENAQSTTSEDIAKWVYGTVGYSIGGTEISGFSQTYSKAQGWWNSSYTYFENIISLLAPVGYLRYYDTSLFDDSINTAYRTFLGGYEGGLRLNPEAYSNTFASCVFDIDYQPLNELAYKAYKSESPLLLEQLDGTAQGLTDFDRFAQNLQEKADRLGNNVMSVNQTTDKADQLLPLNSKDRDGNVMFKRSIAIANNYVQVSYYLSKDYVIKNYFTSITTKYRAYEHIDYSQSVVRKEHKNVFVAIDTEDHPNECETLAYANISDFIKGIMPYDDGDSEKTLRYAIEQDQHKNVVKYELSAVVGKRAICFTYRQSDNATAGSYLKSTSVDSDLGGVLQSYVTWFDDYAEKRQVGYFHDLGYYAKTSEDVFTETRLSPLVSTGKTIANALVKVSDDGTYLKQYKDEGERVSETLQITYVNKASEYFEFTEEFLRNMPWVANSQYGYANALVYSPTSDSKFGKLYPYPNQVGVIFVTPDDDVSEFEDLVQISGNKISLTAFTSVFGTLPYKIVHAYKNANDEWEWVDIAYMKATKSIVLYAYLTDTNTQLVFAEDDDKVLRLMYQDDGKGERSVK